MKTFNVLVTTGGTIVAQGIIKCLKLANSLRPRGPKYRIVTVDMSPDAAGLYRADAGYLVPRITSKQYLDSIIKICKSESIRGIFVGADEELALMARTKVRVQQECGALVITNPLSVIKNCSDKWKTFQFLKRNELPCPGAALPRHLDEFIREHRFPVIVKPREGHGSLNVIVAKDKDEVTRALGAIRKSGWSPIIQEYISESDAEFTTGVTVDRDGKEIMSSIAMRRTLKAGQTYKAFIDDYTDVRRSCEEVALKLGAIGPINIQGRVSKSDLKIFEINPRFSASCPIRAVAKVNEPDIVFRNFVLDEKVKIQSYDKLVCMRYWSEVYVPNRVYEKARGLGKVPKGRSLVPDYF